LFYALLDNLKESNSSSQENEAKSLFSNEDHYMPKRGVRVPKLSTQKYFRLIYNTTWF
jgi:hypothetical protein